MDDRLATRLTTTTEEFDEILGLLSDPNVLADQKRYREVTGRHSELKPVVDAYRRYLEADTESREALEMAAEDDDPEMVAYLNEVAESKHAELDGIEAELQAVARSQEIRTTTKTSSWRSVRPRAETKRRSGLVTSIACTNVSPSGAVGPSTQSMCRSPTPGD